MNNLAQFIEDLRILFKISLLELKVNGIFTTLLSLIIPLGIMMIVHFIGGLKDPDMATQMLSGNLTLVLSQTCIIQIALAFNHLKTLGGFEQYSVFPIKRSAMIFAAILYRFVLIIPFLVALASISVLLLKVNFVFNPVILVVIALTALCFSNIGTLLGISSTDFVKTNNLVNILMFVIMFGTPLFYSITSFPVPIQIVQLMLPFAYVVDAIKRSLFSSEISFRLLLDVAALVLFTIISFILSTFFKKWQVNE